MFQVISEFLKHPPFRMVFISLISISFYLLILLIIKVLFPKQKIPYWIIFLGFSLLPTVSIFREGSYESGDINIHVVRLMSFYKSISEGIIIPRWGGDLNSTYGYATFSYNYVFPYYLSSLYHFLGLNFLNSFKLFLITTYIFSGFAMYLFLRNHFSEKSAFLGSIFYLFAPYHLIDMHFRNAAGEMGAFIFIPLSFYFLDNVIKKGNFLWIFLTGLSTFFLLITHPAVFVMESILILFYIIIRLKQIKLKNILKSFFGIFLGILFASFNWLPVLWEGKFVYQNFGSNLAFPGLSGILFSRWRYGLLFQGPIGELSTILGYAHWIVIFLCLFLIIFKKNRNTILLLFTFFTIIYIFLLQKISRPIWENIFFLKSMIMPYRFILIITFTTSVLASFITDTLKSKKLFYILIVIAIGSTILNWGNRQNTPQIKDSYLAENLPIINDGAWYAYSVTRPLPLIWSIEIPKAHIEAIDGKLDIILEKRKTINHYYIVEMEKDGLVKENTYYFPGWKLYVNGAEKEIIFNTEKYPGIITFNLEKGVNNIELIFTDTPLRKFSFYISAFSLLFSGFYLILTSYKKVN